MLLLLQQGRWAEAQPSPGYYPSSKVSSMPFSQWYSNLWGAQHQSLSPDQTSLTLWMDRSSGQSRCTNVFCMITHMYVVLKFAIVG
ncbi:unnamed protein product [Triticum turgidum subsp. durum]|uniref:Uncharacterized protein n=1 Tax=Triticum turgidum subsp. durum TaxID=4567 RepID=A0A9R0WWW6_TRITD|nr:unnamed protein product [Triticum turgidum subsp. durum]